MYMKIMLRGIEYQEKYGSGNKMNISSPRRTTDKYIETFLVKRKKIMDMVVEEHLLDKVKQKAFFLLLFVSQWSFHP